MCRMNNDTVFMAIMRKSAVSIQMGQVCIQPWAFILKRTRRRSYPDSSWCADNFRLNALASLTVCCILARCVETARCCSVNVVHVVQWRGARDANVSLTLFRAAAMSSPDSSTAGGTHGLLLKLHESLSDEDTRAAALKCHDIIGDLGQECMLAPTENELGKATGAPLNASLEGVESAPNSI